jgi:hypothetical protein
MERPQKITFAEMRSARRARRADLLQTHSRTMRLSDHPAHASAGRDDVKILKNIQGKMKSSICYLAMPVAQPSRRDQRRSMAG